MLFENSFNFSDCLLMVLRTVIRSHDYFRLRAVRDSTSGDNDFVVRAMC